MADYHPKLPSHNFIIKNCHIICKKCNFLPDGICQSINHITEYNNSPVFLDKINICYCCKSKNNKTKSHPCQSSHHDNYGDIPNIAPTYLCYDNQFRCYRCLSEIKQQIIDLRKDIEQNLDSVSKNIISQNKQVLSILGQKLEITTNY